MKKIILSSAVLVLAFTAGYAQIASGTIMLGGIASFGSNTDKTGDAKTTVSSYSFSPMFGIYISENIAVGGGISVTGDKTKNDGDEQKHSLIGLNPFVQYNMVVEDKASCYGRFNFGVGFGKNEDKYETTPGNFQEYNSKVSQFNAGVGVGINYFIKSNISLDLYYAALSFTSETDKPDADGAEKTTNSDFSLNADLQHISLGMFFYFGGGGAAK